VGNPSLLLLDEPLSSLDYRSKVQLHRDSFGVIVSDQSGRIPLMTLYDISSLIERSFGLMKKKATLYTFFVALTYATVVFAQTKDIGLDTRKIDELTGAKGALNAEEGVFKVSFPRTDVKVIVDGWAMKPFMGLTSWAAFKKGMGKEAMVMGDLVLFEDEVNPVMSTALESGLEVTALHNHFFYDDPKVYFMHIGGGGSLEILAKAVRKTQDKIKEIRSASPQPVKGFAGAPVPSESSIDGKAIEKILGHSGQVSSGMFKVVIGRKAKMDHGGEIGKEMGVNTWAAFAGSNESAFVDGDFVVLESELQPVLKALRASGISIVAIHHHMTHEEPRYLFLHYWGRGQTIDLARGVKSALDKTTD
jgi:Domain of Unknown Function (DUF1259)